MTTTTITGTVDEQIRSTIRMLGMLNEAQYAELREAWVALDPRSPAEKRAWLNTVSGDGFTRLARIVMGEGPQVICEAAFAASA